MREMMKNNKHKLIASVSAFVLVVIAICAVYALKFRSTPEVSLIANLKVGQCAVQYNTCAFIELKNEPWERSCEPIFRSFQTVQVGDKKVLFKDLSNNTDAVFPKTMIRERSRNADDALTNSLYLYASDCDKVKKAKVDQPAREEIVKVKEEEKKADPMAELADKCIVLNNNCDSSERWQEDQKYCHPYKNVYKVLEVGQTQLRVVTWHGHGQVSNGHSIPVGTETNLSKEEYSKLGYKPTDCGELVTKYNKNFNPLKGK